MKITVAIPCYNLEDKISTCIESVVSQDYEDLEILVIDDHSTDQSVNVVYNLIKENPEREFHFVVNETNQGLSLVRNTAIEEAGGDALFFIDGDDSIDPGTLALFQTKMEDENVDVVCGSFRKKDKEGNTYVEWQYPEDTIKEEFAYSTYIDKYIKGSFCVAAWNNLYNLEFLRSHSIFCATNYRNYEDCLFTFKVSLNAKSVSFIHDITYNYCDNPSSISHLKKDGQFLQDYQKVVDSLFKEKQNFEETHTNQPLPLGANFLLNYICLTNGLLKNVVEADVKRIEKRRLIKSLKETYRKNNIQRCNIVGPYNKFSYIILKSPIPYTLFRLYFKHLKSFTHIINGLSSMQGKAILKGKVNIR